MENTHSYTVVYGGSSRDNRSPRILAHVAGKRPIAFRIAKSVSFINRHTAGLGYLVNDATPSFSLLACGYQSLELISKRLWSIRHCNHSYSPSLTKLMIITIFSADEQADIIASASSGVVLVSHAITLKRPYTKNRRHSCSHICKSDGSHIIRKGVSGISIWMFPEQ